jgi:hypothetical protein
MPKYMKDWGDFLRSGITLMLDDPVNTRLRFKYNNFKNTLIIKVTDNKYVNEFHSLVN